VVNINQQEKEREEARQLYLEQQKARMAQKLGEQPGLEKMKAERVREGAVGIVERGGGAAGGLRPPKPALAGEGGGAGEGMAGAIEGVGEAAASKGTGELLKQSWMNLITSFGLTLIYINIHFVLRYLMGIKFFCQFGEEWMPSTPGVEEVVGKKAEIAEIIALIFLDLLVLFAILGILTIIGFIVNPQELIKLLGAAILNVITPWPSK